MPPFDPSLKRFITPLVAMGAAAMSTKLGISENLAFAILSLGFGYVLTSKTGEVLIAQAEAKGTAAAAEVDTLPKANDVLKQALLEMGFQIPGAAPVKK